MAGHAAGDRVDRVDDRRRRASRARRRARGRCAGPGRRPCRSRARRRPCSRRRAGSRRRRRRSTCSCCLAVVTGCWRSRSLPPKPPATMLGIERFIASAIRLVRIVPDAPTMHAADDQRGVVERDAGGGRREAGAARSAARSRPACRRRRSAARPCCRGSPAETRIEDEEALGRRSRWRSRSPSATAASSSRPLTICWPRERDRLAGDDLLQLAEGDVRAPEGDRADDRARRGSGSASRAARSPPRSPHVVAVLGPGDERDRAAADAVEQRDHLRHRGHLHAGAPRGRRRSCRSPRRARSGRSRRSRGCSSVADDGDRHADRRDHVALARRRRASSASAGRG